MSARHLATHFATLLFLVSSLATTTQAGWEIDPPFECKAVYHRPDGQSAQAPHPDQRRPRHNPKARASDVIPIHRVDRWFNMTFMPYGPGSTTYSEGTPC